jgi:hypothetical protein
MKTIFGYFSLALLVAAVSSVGAFAQDICTDVAGQTELSQKFTDNYNKPDLAAQEVAVEAGKQFVEKYGACATQKELVEYYNKYIPGMEAKIKAAKAAKEKDALYARFNNAHTAKNWDELYAAGKEVLAKEPDNIDVILALGSVGYDESFKKNYKYNDDTIRYAKLAIQKLNAGASSKTYGVYEWTYGNKDNAIGWMNMSIGYATFLNNKKDALPYIYQASLANSDTKKNPIVYETIGRFYYDQASSLLNEIKTLVADVKDTDPDDVKTQKAAAIKAKVALLNGNAERAIDAYARAYNLAKTDPAKKAYADIQYKKIQELYGVRFPDKPTTGVDAFITASVSKPMPDPTSAVTPIEPEDVKPEASTTTVKPSEAQADTTASIKATAATAAKPSAAPSKTVAKKTVPKKAQQR